MRRTLLAGAVGALLLSVGPRPASAETTDQLLREAAAYVDRGSCDSARSILAEIVPSQRDARVHLLSARTGRCLADVKLTRDALDAFAAAGGREADAEELRRWVESAPTVWRSELDQALGAGDCPTARSVLLRLEAAIGGLPIDRGRLARCRGDVEGVRAVLTELEGESAGDARVQELQAYVDGQSARRAAEQRPTAAAATDPSQAGPRASGLSAEELEVRLRLERRRGAGAALLASGSAVAALGFILNGETYANVYHPGTIDRAAYDRGRTLVGVGLALGIVGTVAAVGGGVLVAFPPPAALARRPGAATPIVSVTVGPKSTFRVRF